MAKDLRLLVVAGALALGSNVAHGQDLDEVFRYSEVRALASVPQQKWLDLRDAIPRLQEIQRRYEREILDLEGVHTIGIGQADGDPVFIVQIERGYPVDRVPAEIEGIRVRVERRDPVQLLHGVPDCTPPCHTDQLPEPLPALMGVSARWIQSSGGCTAGFKACDLGTGRQVFVTNSHCAQFGPNNGCAMAKLGDVVVSPAVGDTNGLNRTVGRITGHAPPSCSVADNTTDATKIDSTAQESTYLIRDIGFGGVFPTIFPVPGALVKSSGRTTGFKWGVLSGVNLTVEVPPPSGGGYCCGALTMVSQSAYDPVGQSFTAGGDSGSPVVFGWTWVQQFNHYPFVPSVAGLLWGSNGIDSFFNPAPIVLNKLNLTLELSLCQ